MNFSTRFLVFESVKFAEKNCTPKYPIFPPAAVFVSDVYTPAKRSTEEDEEEVHHRAQK